MSDGRKARDPELLDILDRTARTTFQGQVWRVVRESRDVLQGSAAGARWDPGTFDVLYTSMNRETALEEVYYHLSRQPVFPSISFHVHRLAARAKSILHLGDSSLLEKFGVETASYSTMNYSKTQAIADAAFFLGCDGIIAPSARSESLNLILFTDRIEVEDLEVELSEPIDWQTWRKTRD